MVDPPAAEHAGGRSIWDVETALAAHPYRTAPVGPFVNDLLVAMGNGRRPAAMQDAARVVRDLVRREGREAEVAPALTGRVLVTLIDDSPRIADLVLPVVAALGDRAAILVARRGLGEGVGAPVLHEAQLAPTPRRDWLREVGRIAPRWARSVTAQRRRGAFPAAGIPALAHLLIVQTQRYERFLAHLCTDRPAAVLVEYDRGAFAAPLVAAARSLAIPTATLVHGSVHPHGYTPLLADLALAWGAAQRQQLVDAGAPPERVVVTGCPRVGLDAWTAQAARDDLGLDDRPLVLVATNNLLDDDDRLRLARVALESVRELGDRVQVGLRLHPRESLADYGELLAGRPGVHLLGGDRAGGDQVLAATDLVLCGITAFADEAAIAGVPTMILDLGSPASGITVGLGDEGPVAHDQAELVALLRRWAGDAEWRLDLERRTIARGSALCETTGTAAAERVARVVLEMTARD